MPCGKPPQLKDNATVAFYVSDTAGPDAVAGAVRDYILRLGLIECGILGWEMAIRPEAELPHPETAEHLSEGIKAIIIE